MNKSPLGINLGHFEETTEFLADNAPDVALLRTLKLDKFRVIRFMDWQKTNNSPVTGYDQLPVAHRSWQFKGGPWNEFRGVPLSLIIETANDMDARPWICIPHKANNDCIERMVSLVVSRANHRPIFEYSNEVWNSQFKQYTYSWMRGIWAGLGFDRVRAALGWQARRTAHLYDTVNGRGDVVIAAQAANSWIATQLLENPELKGKVDALAIAPYFGQKSKKWPWGNWDKLYQYLQKEIETTICNNVCEHKELADRFDIPLWGYEGGQHLLGSLNDAQKRQYMRLNRDERMQELTTQWLNAWYKSGGDLICPYSLTSKYGGHCWGYIEDTKDGYEIRPKFEALLAVEPEAAPIPSMSETIIERAFAGQPY